MSGTRHPVRNIKCREVSLFSAHKNLAPFSYTYPAKKPSFKLLNDQFILADICRVQLNQPTLDFGRYCNYMPHPQTLLTQKIPFINSEKILWVSTMCAQILWFSRVCRVRVSLVWPVSCSWAIGLWRHLENNNIQLRLLDVGFRTFNVTYCTSGSRRVDICLLYTSPSPRD